MKLQDRGTKASALKAPPGLAFTVVPIAPGLFTQIDGMTILLMMTVRIDRGKRSNGYIDRDGKEWGHLMETQPIPTSFEADDAPVVIKEDRCQSTSDSCNRRGRHHD